MTRIFKILPVVTGFTLMSFLGLAEAVMGKIEIQSPAFAANGTIPSEYTCDGKNISPPLTWSEAPLGTRSFVLIVDDPDAPGGTWVHWGVYDIPPDVKGLPGNVPKAGDVPSGGIQGTTDFLETGYGGPCPPGGTHRYFFKIHALDIPTLGLGPGATKQEVEKAMRAHVIASGEMKGLYSRVSKGR